MEVQAPEFTIVQVLAEFGFAITAVIGLAYFCLLYTSDAADE